MRITLDTGVLPADALLAAVKGRNFDFAVVSVTVAETQSTSFVATLKPLGEVDQNVAFGAGVYGAHTYGGTPDKECLRKALEVISNGAFADPEPSDKLTDGERSQQHDAIILCTHVRDQRDVLVTTDQKAFIKGERRERLESLFHTRIMTPDEFIATFGPHGGAAA
jgi:hypothetical protein